MKVKDLVEIGYVAVRGQSDEQGAVQRILSKSRVKSIKDFILKENTFVSSFILNWTEENTISIDNEGKLNLQIKPGSAQILDGQHRVAGFKEAIQEKKEIENYEVLVTIYKNLNTSDAAQIFLNINSEQKPVPKSLVYDLFKQLPNNTEEERITDRAWDIADYLNKEENSPYRNYIKFPGSNRGNGSIQLSTVITALKQHLKNDGIFQVTNISELDMQKQVILNFFTSIYSYYSKAGFWEQKTKNPFLKAVGFNGAIDYLTSTLIPRCADDKKFTVEHMKSILLLDAKNLLLLDDVKLLGGTAGRNKVESYLKNTNKQHMYDSDEYEF